MSAKREGESEMGKALLLHCGNSDLKRVLVVLGPGLDAAVLNYQNNSGSNALIVSCGINNEKIAVKLVTTLLDAGINLNTTNKNGVSALMVAASMSYPAVVDILLRAGADYSLKNKDGKTAFELTKNRNIKDLIQSVIDAKAEAEKQAAVKERGEGLVDLLYQKDCAGILELISNNSFVEVYNVSLEPRGDCEFTRPLEIAVHLCLVDAVEMLLNAGADPDVTHPRDDSTMIIRLCAQSRAPSYPTTAYSRDKEAARYQMLESLIRIGKASVNAARKDSWTALMLAAVNEYAEDIQLLLHNRANPNITEKHGDTALILATKRNRVESVRLLLDGKARPDIAGAEGMTSLMWAAFKNNVAIIQLLIRVNTKCNMRAKCGRTALCFAVQQGNADAVSALVRAGSTDPNIPVLVTQTTPLMIASRSNNSAIVDMLLEDSVILTKLNQQSNNGDTALFWAASYGHVDIVVKLLIAGGNPFLLNREGNSAYSSARSDNVREAIMENVLDIHRNTSS